MFNQTKKIYSKWKYLGFSEPILKKYEKQLARENLRLLNTMLWVSLFTLSIIEMLLLVAMVYSPYTKEAIYKSLITVLVTIVLLLLQIRQYAWLLKHRNKYSVIKISRVATSIYLIVIDLAAILVEVVFYPDVYSTITCGLLLVSQMMFITYPIDNLIYISCFSCFFLVMDSIFKKPDILIYDVIDSIPFLIIGVVISWRNAHSKWSIIITSDHEQQLERENTDRKLKEGRIDIMLTQIQPHFLYNTLESIAELCHRNAIDAEKAILEFSNFLRGDLSVINGNKVVTFEQELKHVEHYLYCEKIRFDERLDIQYDIKCTDFMVPPLSIQPIVENAVRNGVSKKEEGGTICIETRENDKEWIVKILDNGVGYSPPISDNEKYQHIGIKNVRNRIEEQFEGSLEIHSVENVGTTVIMKFPKKSENKLTKMM